MTHYPIYRDVDVDWFLPRLAWCVLVACLAALAAGCPGPLPPPVVTPPTMRPVTVIVQGTDGPLAGAAVRLDDIPAPHDGTTGDDGRVTFSAPASLSTTHLWVTATGYVDFDAPQVLSTGPALLEVTLTAAQPPPAPVDPLDIRANFCALPDPETGRAIFTSEWTHQDAETRPRWLEVAREDGDTHYVIGLHAGGYHDLFPPTPGFYPDHIPEAVALIRELLAARFVPVVFLHTGGPFPAEGAAYFTRFLAGIPSDLYQRVIWVPGWEVVPGDWTTKQFVDATRAIREALGGDALAGPWMAAHLGDGRLSFSSHPGEPDDPFRRWAWPVRNGDGTILDWEAGPHIGDESEQDKKLTDDPDACWAGDEIASWRSWYGQQYRFLLYQSALIRQDDPLDDRVGGSTWERAHEVLTRVVGDHWQGAPDWFSGLPVRPIPVWFEQNEELYIRGRETRERMLAIAAAARAMGWRGYGAGAPAK